MQDTKYECLCKEAAILAVNAKTATGRENTFFNSVETIECYGQKSKVALTLSSSHHRQKWTPEGLQLSVWELKQELKKACAKSLWSSIKQELLGQETKRKSNKHE